MSHSESVTVCIVGAGISGLSAAASLIEGGIDDVLLVEAQHRIGGRVHTVTHGEEILELGAQWVHGEDGNSVFDYAQKRHPGNLEVDMNLIQTGTGNTSFVDPSGCVMDHEIADKFTSLMAKLESIDMTGAECSYGEFLEKQFATLNEWGSKGWQLLDWQGRFQCIIDGSPHWHDISPSLNEHYEECPGLFVINWSREGYQLLVNSLVDRVGNQRIHLNTPVMDIKYGEGSDVILKRNMDELQVDLSSGQKISPSASSVSLRVKDGPAETVIECDHVIVTVSLGVLKAKAQEMFHPPLPAAHLNAVEGLSIDCIAKIYLEFENRWWPEDLDGFSFLNDLTCDLPDPSEHWDEHVLGFYRVHRQPRMLCCWMAGPPARAVERTDETEVLRKCWGALRKRLQHLYDVSEPIWCRRTSWGTNPYTRGSYSYRSPRTDQLGATAADLARPVTVNGKPVLCFAGEATHSGYFGTVHGAFDSGAREAKRLTEIIQRTEEEAKLKRKGSSEETS